MEEAKIDDGVLYIKYTYFSPSSFSRSEHEDYLPIKIIDRVEGEYGDRGGFLGFKIFLVDRPCLEFGRKQKYLYSLIEDLGIRTGLIKIFLKNRKGQ